MKKDLFTSRVCTVSLQQHHSHHFSSITLRSEENQANLAHAFGTLPSYRVSEFGRHWSLTHDDVCPRNLPFLHQAVSDNLKHFVMEHGNLTIEGIFRGREGMGRHSSDLKIYKLVLRGICISLSWGWTVLQWKHGGLVQKESSSIRTTFCLH